MPRKFTWPLATVAWPAIGVRHEPSSAARNARSHASAVAVSASIDRRQQRAGLGVVGAGLDADRALPDRRQEFVELEHRRRRIGETEPLQPGQRQQRRVGLALVELAQPRLDVAAQIDDPQIGPQPPHQRLAAQRRGADHRAARQLGEVARLAADEDVARVLARQKRREHQPVRQEGRHVLGRMHREVDAALEQRLLDLLGEQALAAGLGQRPVLDPVAGGADHLDLDPRRIEAMRLRQRVAHHAGLRQRQRAAARADPQNGRSSLGLRHRTSQWLTVCTSCELSAMIVLGIETTCDETAAAVVERHDDGPGKILSNVVLSQVNEHAAFGGVVPEIAARAHVEALDRVIAKAMADAGAASTPSTASPPRPGRD